MATTHQRTASTITPWAYTGFANSVVMWILVVHLLGWAMSRSFESRIGFAPVWFFDCTACLPKGGALPVGIPVVGGLSFLAVGAALMAWLISTVTRAGMPARIFRRLCIVAAIVAALYAVVGVDTRYPGSLPGVLVVAAPGAIAAATYAIAAVTTIGRSQVGPIVRPRLTGRSVAAAGLGGVSMAVLGGLISIVTLTAGIIAWSRAPDARNRRFALTGAVLGIASFILRWSVVDRYPSLIGPIL